MKREVMAGIVKRHLKPAARLMQLRRPGLVDSIRAFHAAHREPAVLSTPFRREFFTVKDAVVSKLIADFPQSKADVDAFQADLHPMERAINGIDLHDKIRRDQFSNYTVTRQMQRFTTLRPREVAGWVETHPSIAATFAQAFHQTSAVTFAGYYDNWQRFYARHDSFASFLEAASTGELMPESPTVLADITEHTRKPLKRLRACYPWLPRFIYGSQVLDRNKRLPFPFHDLLGLDQALGGGVYAFSGLFFVYSPPGTEIPDYATILHESIHSVINTTSMKKFFDYLGIKFAQDPSAHTLIEGITEVLTVNALDTMGKINATELEYCSPKSLPDFEYMHYKELEDIVIAWRKISNSSYRFETMVAAILIKIFGFENFVRMWTEPPENLTERQQKILSKIFRIMARHYRKFASENYDFMGMQLTPSQIQLTQKLLRAARERAI